MARWHTTEFDFLPENAFRSRGGKFGPMTLEGGKGGGGAPAADPNIGIAQREIAALSREQWQTFKTDIYPEMLKQSRAQEARAQAQYELTSQITKEQQERSTAAYKRYEEGAIPAMQKLKADADMYNEAGYQEQLAGQAMGDIKSQAANAQAQTEMRQRAYGIDPTSGVAAANANANQIQLAGMQAAAANQTRQAAKDIGLQKQANVYNMYAGLPAQANTNTGLALSSSAQGLAGGQTGISNYGATGGALNSAAGTAIGGWGQVGQLGVGATNAANAAYAADRNADAASSAGLGQALGTGVTAYAIY